MIRSPTDHVRRVVVARVDALQSRDLWGQRGRDRRDRVRLHPRRRERAPHRLHTVNDRAGRRRLVMEVEPCGVFALARGRYVLPCGTAVRRALHGPCVRIRRRAVHPQRDLGRARLDGLDARGRVRRGVGRPDGHVLGVAARAVGAQPVFVLVPGGGRRVGIVLSVPRHVGDVDPRAVVRASVNVDARPRVRPVHARVVVLPRDALAGIGDALELAVLWRVGLRVPALRDLRVDRSPGVAACRAVVVVVHLAVDVHLYRAVPVLGPSRHVHIERDGASGRPVAVVVQQHVVRAVRFAVHEDVVVGAVLGGVLVVDCGSHPDAPGGVIDAPSLVYRDVSAVPAVEARDLYLSCVLSHGLPPRCGRAAGRIDEHVDGVRNGHVGACGVPVYGQVIGVAARDRADGCGRPRLVGDAVSAE